MHTRMLHAEFPTTGQPIRVILTDDEPWFAVADVCRILGRTQPGQAVKFLGEDEVRVVNTRTPQEGVHEAAGQRGFSRGNPDLEVVSESGLYRLIVRSDQPTARPFQDWVTRELLPSIRRDHTDLGAAREHTAETFAEAINFGTVPDPEPVSAFELLGQSFQLYSDGFVHCPHGAMDPVFPAPDEDDGPPYGPHFRCTRTERVRLLGSRARRLCPPVRLTDLARACHRRPAAPPGSVLLIAGTPTDVLTVLNGVR
ncbi:BRO-N domain-containing protein [Streptacidiphilus anmyonensis]|uniref:BRO-N domain-containing protein n=1 Tax=Streptacidiphilus anmyonensis TaxID=405782 RepID=UPI000A0061CD|nr:Bro-N domain-containing protein [Streptacidiphilus anmyonensis]